MADVAHDDSQTIKVRLTERVLAAFDRLNVFPGHESLAPDPKRIVIIPKNVTFEEYSSFVGDTMFSVGALSYCQTPRPTVSMGRYCSIAVGLMVLGERHPLERVTSSSFTYCFLPHYNKPQFVRAHERLLGNAYKPDMPARRFDPIPAIGHDVWIGQNVQMARGITIGTGSVIAAASVVTKDIAPYTIVGGNPARVIRPRFREDIAARLLRSEWWTLHPRVLYDFGYDDPERFCEGVESANGLPRWDVKTWAWRDLLAGSPSLAS